MTSEQTRHRRCPVAGLAQYSASCRTMSAPRFTLSRTRASSSSSGRWEASEREGLSEPPRIPVHPLRTRQLRATRTWVSATRLRLLAQRACVCSTSVVMASLLQAAELYRVTARRVRERRALLLPIHLGRTPPLRMGAVLQKVDAGPRRPVTPTARR